MELKVDISSWNIDSVRILGKKTGGRQTLVRRISFTKKLEVLHATINLAETKIRTEQDYSDKVQEIRRRQIP
jgi:ABC-type histidine transport system ATPase subunit